jgi:hypothetical protein
MITNRYTYIYIVVHTVSVTKSYKDGYPALTLEVEFNGLYMRWKGTKTWDYTRRLGIGFDVIYIES